MSETLSDPLVETLIADFGGNYVFALDLLESYRADRKAVDKSWRDVAEDKVDSAEDKADANGVEKYNALDRHERRTWRRILRGN